MSIDTSVIRLRQPDAIDDPLTDLAREGARRMLATVLVAEADAFVALWRSCRMGVTGSCVTAMGRSARSRLGSGLLRSGGRRSATAARWARRRRFGLRRRSVSVIRRLPCLVYREGDDCRW
jgi:hypothetical protein